MVHCRTPAMATWSRTLRISVLRLLMKYFWLLLKSLFRSRTTCTFTLNKSATSYPVRLHDANIFTIFIRSATSSWRRVRLFLFGNTWMLFEWASWSDCLRDSVVYFCIRCCDMTSSPALIAPEPTFSCCTLLLKLLRIYEADLAYWSSYSWLSRWWLVVSSPSKPLKDSGSKRSAVLSRIELLRTYLRT